MITVAIPGRDTIEIEHIALDYNGTIAADGKLIDGIAGRIKKLSAFANVYILTADTYGTVKAQCENIGAIIKTFPTANAADCKLEIVEALGGRTACIGNGFNDIKMFDIAGLSIAVMDKEGVCAALIPHADVLVRSAEEALDLLIYTDRLRATLRT